MEEVTSICIRYLEDILVLLNESNTKKVCELVFVVLTGFLHQHIVLHAYISFRSLGIRQYFVFSWILPFLLLDACIRYNASSTATIGNTTATAVPTRLFSVERLLFSAVYRRDDNYMNGRRFKKYIKVVST